MQFIDTHCHIHEPDFSLPIAGVLQRAHEAGVTKMVCVGTDVVSSQQAVAFAAEYPDVWASVGIHPHESEKASVVDLQVLLAGSETPEATAALASGVERASSTKVIAIGECGLDYFYHHASKKAQHRALHAQIELALMYKLPLIFHIREAFNDFWPVFDSYQGLRGVLHSFTDTQDNLEKALERGLYIGVNGIATFTKVDAQLAMFKAIPSASLLLETDAPFLTPQPYRGTVNEPAHVATTAEFLAVLRGEPLAGLARATTRNVQTLLKI